MTCAPDARSETPSDRALGTDAVRQYRHEGYTLVPDLIGEPMLDMLEAEFDYLVQEQARHGAVDATWHGSTDQVAPTAIIDRHDLQAFSADFARFLFHEPLVDAFAALLGTDNVQLHHTKMFQKPPENGSAFPPHQDKPFFPHASDAVLAAIIHLSDSDEERGCVRVWPGSHRRGELPRPDGGRDLSDADWPVETATSCLARRGDVLFFNYLTVHASGVNRSDALRKTILIQVRDAAAELLDGGFSAPNHASGLMLRGRDPVVMPGRKPTY